MVSKIKKSKIVCVSHREDADGISSAALIKQAFGGETILVDYPGMMDSMEPLRTDQKLKELYCCWFYFRYCWCCFFLSMFCFNNLYKYAFVFSYYYY